jgi:hypothetical protein
MKNAVFWDVVSQDLHGATSQKMAFFIATAVKTSNPTKCINVGGEYVEK